MQTFAIWYAGVQLTFPAGGISRDDIVGVNLKDNPEHLAMLFALARIGAAALPMDWRWTVEEKSRLTTFFEPRLVLSKSMTHLPTYPDAGKAL